MTFHDEQDILYFFFVFGGISIKDDPVISMVVNDTMVWALVIV